jgi:hypothetical protein
VQEAGGVFQVTRMMHYSMVTTLSSAVVQSIILRLRETNNKSMKQVVSQGNEQKLILLLKQCIYVTGLV